MKTFFAQMPNDKYIHIPADHMELVDDMIFVYEGQELKAAVDISVILYANIVDSTE